MPGFFANYLAAWVFACTIALGVAVVRRRELEIAGRAYWRLLLVPWKVTTFAVAGAAVTLVAPYTGDPTWDHFDAAFMSVLAFAGAPWALGVLYQALRGWQPPWKALVAACLWLFSASWSYDLYILLRDGDYPITWAANLAASSVLYASAGLLWSLESRAGRGVIFGFMARDWPAPPEGSGFGKLAWYALPLMALAAAMLVPFVLDYLGRAG